MFYFFYGENNYLLNEKVTNIKHKFISSQGELNIASLDGENLTQEEYTKAVLSMPFLGSKKLIIIKNLVSKNKNEGLKEYLVKNIDKSPSSSIVLFLEQGTPDKRTKLFKILRRPGFFQEFSFLPQDKIGRWIEKKANELGGKISREANIKLQILAGRDLYRLENEITKLVLFHRNLNPHSGGEDEGISEDEVSKIVSAGNTAKVFDFIDFLAQKNYKQAFSSLNNLISLGEDEIFIFLLIVSYFRNLFLIKELSEKGLSPQKIASTAKIHPFVVSKNLSAAKNFTKDSLISIYLALQKIDFEIKSGAVDPNVALNLLAATLDPRNNFAKDKKF